VAYLPATVVGDIGSHPCGVCPCRVGTKGPAVDQKLVRLAVVGLCDSFYEFLPVFAFAHSLGDYETIRGWQTPSPWGMVEVRWAMALGRGQLDKVSDARVTWASRHGVREGNATALLG
jgi:hypothetical protein